MSAIVSIHYNHTRHSSAQHGLKMLQSLQHYPADRVHSWHDEQVFLGCHAQWITPESVNEPLPLYDPLRRLAITSDAIIDNRSELFRQLQIDPSQREDMPDSLLILLAYERWGEDVPLHLVGDFAFVIWDEKKRTLFGARDFSGSRTLYFSRTDELTAFSTTMQPLLELPGVSGKLNEMWLAEFLAIPIITDSVDPYASVYQSIAEVPPSHSFAVFDGKLTFNRYCSFKHIPKSKLKSDEEYEEAFREVFDTAVKARLRTHRRVGSQLSGGLDSGSVVSFAARALRADNKPLHTFSFVPLEDFVDWTPKRRIPNERPNIEAIVNYVGNIQASYLDCKGMDPLSDIEEWLDLLEMPYKFFINTFWMRGIYEQASKSGVGVLLNGKRGNSTISWGPALDYHALLLKQLKLLRFYRELDQYSSNVGIGRKFLLRLIGKKTFPAISRMLSRNNEELSPVLINPNFAARTQVFAKLREHGFDQWGTVTHSAYQARQQHFEQLYFWNVTGINATKLSLRYGLWERDPTNDLRVVRFCLSVPESQFVQNGLDRALIRRATRDYLPDNIRLDQRSRGLQGADSIMRMTASWPALIAELHQLSDDPLVADYLNIAEIKTALARIGSEPSPEYLFDLDFKMLMRGLIFYRFLIRTMGRR